MYKTCTINGKAVKRLYINNRLAYSSEPDMLVTLNALQSDFLAREQVGTGSYNWQSQTYSYDIYTMPTLPVWAPWGPGNLNPWFAAPNMCVTAAHWASALQTGSWTGGQTGLNYNIASWTNLREWALANGWTSDQLKGMSDIGDIVVTTNSATNESITQEVCPKFASSQWVRDNFWKGSLAGVVGYHAPQDILVTGDGGGCGGCGCGETTPVPMGVPVIMQSNFSWAIPKSGYSAIPDRDSTTRTVAQSYSNTYLAYTGDSGKPTWIYDPSEGGFGNIVVSQCHSQFAGPDFCACLPVLKAWAEANGHTINTVE